jgi:hypothetical protein
VTPASGPRRAAWTSDPSRVEVLVVGAGAQPGPDAAAAAREIAARLPDGHPGRVLLAVHPDQAAVDGDVTDRPLPVPPHRVGPILLDWAARGLRWAQTRDDLDVVRSRLADLDGPAALHRLGVEVAYGRVAFLGRGRVALDPSGAADTYLLNPNRVVLATGSGPTVPDVPGIAETQLWTPSSLLDLSELPGSIVVLGAGSLGCEVAQGLARLGSTVTLVDARPRALPDADPQTSATVEQALRADGVRLLLGATVEKVAPTLDGGAWVGTDIGGDVAAQALVVAAGRRPRTAGLDLAAAGIRTDGTGAVLVDDRLRTTCAEVLACGEVTGLAAYGAAPGPMARVVAVNAVSRRPGLRWAPPIAASVTRTDPQVVRIGDLVGPETGPGADLDADPKVERGDGAGLGESAGPTPGSSVRVLVGPPSGRGILGLGGPSARNVVAATLVGAGAAEAAGHLVLTVNATLPAAALVDTAAADGTWAAAIQFAVARALATG